MLYELHDRPSLDDPVMVMVLEGWIDAGYAAATAAQTLLGGLDTYPVATFDTDALLDHRARRPIMHLVDGVNTGLSWPSLELRAGIDGDGNDVLLLLGAEPVGFTIIPRRNGRTWELGSVSFANLRWYNAAPAALAPFLVLLVPLAVAWWRTRSAWHFEAADLALTLLLAPQFLSFWPSPVDWKLALRSWPYLLIIAAAGLAALWFETSLFRFVKA